MAIYADSPATRGQASWIASPGALAGVLVFTVGLLLIELIIVPDANLFFKEGYGVERVTVALYALAIAMWFAYRGIAAGLADWQVPALLALFAMREMDFDKRFTETGLLKLQYYIGPGPVTGKLAGILLLLVVAVVLVRLARRNLGPLLSGLRAGLVEAWVVVSAGVLVVAAKAIDGIDRKLAPLGIEVSPSVLERFGRSEEVMELVFVALLAWAIALYGDRAARHG